MKNNETDYEVYNKDYKDLLNSLNVKFDLVFLDPPYALKIHNEIIDTLKKNNLLEDDALIAIETDVNDSIFNNDYPFFREYKYGTIKLTVIKI